MIFVAGNSGQVALSLKEAAAARGLALQTHGRPAFDICNPAASEKTIVGIKPSAIVNAAAYTAVDQAESDEETAYAINATGAATLAKIAYKLGVPFIHLSTDYVFDGSKSAPYSEGDTTGPTGAYGRSKLEGERLVLEANPSAIILRTAWVYSPFGKNFLKTMLSLADRDSIGVVADQVGNPTYAPDIAAAVLDILAIVQGEQGSNDLTTYGGIYHLAGTGSTSWHGFAEAIFKAAAKTGTPPQTVEAITTAQYPTPAKRPANSQLDCTKLRTTFGISLPEWQSSTAICVKRISDMNH